METAATLGLSLMSVNRLVRSRRLKDHKVGGKSMIRLREIKRFLAKRAPAHERRWFFTG